MYEARTTDIINAIDAHARKREALLKRLEQLPPENETVINELWKLDGIAGEVARCYYIDGADVKLISKWLEYSTRLPHDKRQHGKAVLLSISGRRERTKLLCNVIATRVNAHIYTRGGPLEPRLHTSVEL